MPALLPVSRVIQLTFAGTYFTQPWVNVLHWQYTAGPIGAADIVGLCNQAVVAWGQSIGDACSASVSLTAVRGIDLSAPDAPQGASSAPAEVGSLPGTGLPVNCAAVVSWIVNYRWRGGHFRSYMPVGVTTSITNGNTWSSTGLNLFRQKADDFLVAMNAITIAQGGGALVGVRRWRTEVKGQPPVAIDPPLVLPYTSVLVDSRIDSQRRRLGRDVAA